MVQCILFRPPETTGSGYTEQAVNAKIKNQWVFGQALYTDRSGWYYPDFIRDELVFDAKYKRVENGIQREDRYQMISYMHVLKAKCGYLIFPPPLEKYESPPPKVLNGHGGKLGVLTFDIPSQHENWDDFVLRMTDSENHFREIMQILEQKTNCVEEQNYDTTKYD